MLNKKLAILTLVVMIAPLVLVACGPTPEPIVVKETSVVVETLTATTSERQGRLIDHDQSGAMEKKKQEGYF